MSVEINDRDNDRDEVKRYKNPLGSYTRSEWDELILDGKYKEYHNGFKTTNRKCPPKQYTLGIMEEYGCFRCELCRETARCFVLGIEMEVE